MLPLVLWLSARPQTLTYALLPAVERALTSGCTHNAMAQQQFSG